MLKFFKRRQIDLGPDPLAVRDLLDQPALREVMEPVQPDAPVSFAWTRLMAAGPIRFDRPLEHAA